MAAEAPLVPASQHAGGALVVVDPDGQEAPLSLRKYHIDVHLEDGFARTTIDQTYFNHELRQLEGTFYFPLPADASLSRLAMYVDGNLMEGGMAERDYARQVFETIVARRKDPALLEWVDGTTFRMRVFPLEARQEKRIILSYTQRLPVLYGRMEYRFPAGHSLGVVRDWSFHARVKNGVPLAWNCESHSLKETKEGADLLLDLAAQQVKPDRDVVLQLFDRQPTANGDEAIRFSSTEHEGAKYLMLRFRLELPSLGERPPRHWVFLFESSGDRDPLLARTQIEVIRSLLANAEADDTFAVLTAGTNVHTFADEPRPVTAANVEAAIAFLETTHLIGALDLGKALTEADRLLKAGKNQPYLVHVGSGIAALGERREDVLVKHLGEGVRYVGIGVGKRWGNRWMRTAADQTGGYVTQINPNEPISWRAFEVANILNAPRLLNLRVADETEQVRFLPWSHVITPGEEVCAIARLGPEAPKLPESVILMGTLDDKPFRRVLAVREVTRDAAYLPRTWVKLEIDRLLAENATENKDRIVALSKAMYVMTPFTSLLVLENEGMYRQYHVDGGRKDHWAMYPCPPQIPVVHEPLTGTPLPKGNDPRPPAPRRVSEVLQTILVRRPRPLLSVPTQPQQDEESSFLDALQVVSGAYALSGDLARVHADVLRNVTLVGGDLAGQPAGMELTRVEGGVPALPQQAVPWFPGQGFGIGGAGLAGAAGLGGGGIGGIGGLPFGGLGMLRPKVGAGAAVGAAVEEPIDIPFLPSAGWKYQPAAPASVKMGFESLVDDLHHGQVRWGPVPTSRVNGPARTVPMDTEESLARLANGYRPPSLLYHRPRLTHDERVFSDLMAYAPGMQTTRADILAAVEAEAGNASSPGTGRIDPAARQLIDKARTSTWTHVVMTGENGKPTLTLVHDGQGHYIYERVLPWGLQERAICDGLTVWHLYPELAVGARRRQSRFHLQEFIRLAPWILPPVEDLARGADLLWVNHRTVALIPRESDLTRGRADQTATHTRIHLIFREDGRLEERRLLEMPSGRTLLRETYDNRAVKLLDARGVEVSVRRLVLSAATEPELKPDDRDLLVLPMPPRTLEWLRETHPAARNLPHQEMDTEVLLALVASESVTHVRRQALDTLARALPATSARQLGLMALMSDQPPPLGQQWRGRELLARFPGHPLARYLLPHYDPYHENRVKPGRTENTGEGFLARLNVLQVLASRLTKNQSVKKDGPARRADRKRALRYMRRNAGSHLGWAMLALRDDEGGGDEGSERAVAEAYRLFEDLPDIGDAARYEYARHLLKHDRVQEARAIFRTLYTKALEEGELPRIDQSFRQALRGNGRETDEWQAWMEQTARQLIAAKRRPEVAALARQCWELGDQELADRLVELALNPQTVEAERLPTILAVIEYLSQSCQHAKADQLLQTLLTRPAFAQQAALWRLGAFLATKRQLPARQRTYLERAIDLEYRQMPNVIDLSAVQNDFALLLTHYQQMAWAMAALEIEPSTDFLVRVVRATDRWRSLGGDGSAVCRRAGWIFQTLGARELAWEYFTMSVSRDSYETSSWAGLAEELKGTGDRQLVDRAYAAAFDVERVEPGILLSRAENLQEMGQTVAARRLLQQIAEGSWPSNAQEIQAKAREQLEGR
jgi:hypothetical protein